jgi:uncharacterized membrane protein HdeD (DUF308 family)
MRQILAIFYPGITALALVLVIGVNAIISGVLDVSMALRLRREIEGEWLLALGVVLIAAAFRPRSFRRGAMHQERAVPG